MPDDINGHLARIEGKIDRIATNQGKMQNELTRIQTTQTASIERSKEDRARISVLEGNMSKAWSEIGQIRDRQRGWAAVQSVVAAVFAAIAAWIGINK